MIESGLETTNKNNFKKYSRYLSCSLPSLGVKFLLLNYKVALSLISPLVYL